MTTIEWIPQHPEKSRLWQFMRFAENQWHESFKDYQSLHAWSIHNPAAFWQTLCDFFRVHFDTPAQTILLNEQNMIDARWFTGASLNFAKHLLPRQDEHTAIIAVNEKKERRELSYKVLYQQVAHCAEGLKAAGVKKGDRVAGIMPNIPETIIAMLATASLGAVWSSCSPDFGETATTDRLGQIEPKILISVDGYTYQGKPFSCLEKIKHVSEMIPGLTHVVIYPFLQQNSSSFSRRSVEHCLKTSTCHGVPTESRDPADESQHADPRTHRQSILSKTTIPFISWSDFLRPSTSLTFTSVPFDHPLYILFSSGTTGKPKCIVHSVGGTLLQHIKELALHTDLKPEDNLCFFTTCGWMMWNWMVSALALGTTLTLYEGAPTYPDASRLFQLIHDEKITVFGTSAKFISAVEKSGFKPTSQYAMSTLRCILSTGSPLLPQHYDFVYTCIKPGVQLSSISGGTDIVSCFALGNPLLPVYRGELQCLGLGMAVAVFDDQGHAVDQTRGELVCTKPFPAMPIGFWNDPDNTRYKQAYFSRFPNTWTHGDFAEITKHNGLIIYGRSDAVLNSGGVRIGTAEIYRQVEQIPEILDSVVIGQTWEDDVRIVLFVKLRPDVQLDDTLEKKIRTSLRQNASPRHVPAIILQVPDIPRTLSGKTVEIAVRQVVHNQAVCNQEALANPEALEFFRNRSELQQ